jgi:hypothetical protein
MRRLLIVVLMAFVGIVTMPESACAQIDLSKIGGLFGGATSKPKQSPYKTLAENAPAKGKIVGEWKYDSFDIEYLGSNTFADNAIAQLRQYTRMELQNLGVKANSFNINLNTNGKCSFNYGDIIYEGSYTYDVSSAQIVISAKADNGGKITCNGFLKFKDGKFVIMLAAQDAIKAIGVVVPEVVADPTFATIKSAVDSFPGIFFSMYYHR